MKIYEIRDITDDEQFFQHRFCETKEEAILAIDECKQDISHFADDNENAIIAVFEHEVGVWDYQSGFAVKVYEKTFSKVFDDSDEDVYWKEEVTFEKI